MHILVGQLSGGSEQDWQQETLSVLRTGLAVKCPRCGKGRLLNGMLSVQKSCSYCSLSFANHENGDGPAFFAIAIVSILVAVMAAFTEIIFSPPYWLHTILWLPLILAGSFFVLRWSKGILIALQYRHQPDSFHD
jgi:uncharacterized protein (DUF983 family)